MYSRLAIAAALAPLASAFTITLNSACSFPVYGWNVVDGYGAGPPEFTLDSSNPSWSASFESKVGGGGPSIKLKKNNNIFDGGAVTQVEYKMTGDTLFYDLSLINGMIFSGEDVLMKTSNANCPTVHCLPGDSVCAGAYYHPDDTATLGCTGGADIEVTMCGGSAAPAPAAAPPAAPPAPGSGGNFLQEGQDGNVKVVVATTVVPVTVTVTGSSTDATAAPAKREAHAHEHARRHSRIMGRAAH